MTLGRAHQLGMALATSLALLAVLWGGQLPATAWIAVGVPWLAMLSQEQGRTVPPLAGLLLGVAGFAGGSMLVASRGVDGLIPGGTLVLLALLAGRSLTRTSLRHDMQSLLLSLFLVFAATVVHTALTFAITFVAYAVAVVWALLARQLVVGAAAEEARGGPQLAATLARRDVTTPALMAVTAGVAVILLASTVLLFLAFPRVGFFGLGFVQRGRGGLPALVSLTDLPRASLGGGEAIARVRGLSAVDHQRGLYLRGPVYDQVRKSGFFRSASDAPVRSSLETELVAGRQRAYEVFMHPVAAGVLLSLGTVETVDRVMGGTFNPGLRVGVMPPTTSVELRASVPLTGPVRYAVRGSVLHANGGAALPPESADAAAGWREKLAHYLDTSGDLDPRIARLTEEVLAGEEDFARRVERIRGFLQQRFSYSLEQSNSDKPDPLAAFLFEDRRGHCEYFATALAVMLRFAGVPARVVGGFQGGWLDEQDNVVVFTADNAHAWVEWYLPGVGWVVDDATPPSPPAQLTGLAVLLERLRRGWDDWVVEYNMASQFTLLDRLGKAMGQGRGVGALAGLRRVGLVGLAVLLTAVGVVILVRLRRRVLPGRREPELYRAIAAAFSRVAGKPVAASATMREAVGSLLERRDDLDPGVGALFRRALLAYEHQRFKGVTVDPRLVKEITRNLRSLR
jgi:hypothetical protein